jgi:hypothetical protein
MESNQNFTLKYPAITEVTMELQNPESVYCKSALLLLSQMLQEDPKARICASLALQQSFFNPDKAPILMTLSKAFSENNMKRSGIPTLRPIRKFKTLILHPEPTINFQNCDNESVGVVYLKSEQSPKASSYQPYNKTELTTPSKTKTLVVNTVVNPKGSINFSVSNDNLLSHIVKINGKNIKISSPKASNEKAFKKPPPQLNLFTSTSKRIFTEFAAAPQSAKQNLEYFDDTKGSPRSDGSPQSYRSPTKANGKSSPRSGKNIVDFKVIAKTTVKNLFNRRKLDENMKKGMLEETRMM